jgi:cytochrome P450
MAARSAAWCARTPFGLAVLRHREAGHLLRDRRLRQGSHAWPDTVGLSGAFAGFWKRSVISQEADPHRALRRVAREALDDTFVLGLSPAFTAIAAELGAGLRQQESFDMIEAFTEPFAGRAIARLLGEPIGEAPDIGRDASTLGLAMGLDARTHETAVNAATERLSARAARLIQRARNGRDTESFVARLVSAADRHGLHDPQALIDLVVISIFGGVDTTRAQLGFAFALFAAHPDQWHWLRSHTEAIPQAIEEVIRTRPTTTWATREALENFTFEGVDIHVGDILHVFVHASGTDPLIGPRFGFDIRVRRKMHFGFGGGAHHCLGQFVARTDMACAIGVLLKLWRGVRIVGTPEFLPNSGNTSPARLQIAPDWAVGA